jgi:hypothetical protein
MQAGNRTVEEQRVAHTQPIPEQAGEGMERNGIFGDREYDLVAPDYTHAISPLE